MVVDRVADSAAQLGRGIRNLRKQKGWNQDRLATRAGLNRATISLLESGKTNPSFGTVEDLASALGSTVSGVMAAGRVSLLLSNQDLKDVFAENVRSRRLALGLTRTELGQRVGLLPQYISTTENARRLPLLENSIKLAAALELDLYLLLLDEKRGPIKERATNKLGRIRTPLEIVGEMHLIRKKRGWSRMDVCRATGVDPVNLANLEAGDQTPTIPTLVAFAEGVGIPLWRITQESS